jgi:ATP-dependent DNA helicase RecG
VGNSSTHLPAPSSQESTEKKEILTNNVPAKSLRGTIHGESSTQNLDSKLGFAKNSDSLNNVSARFEQFKKLFGEERTGLIHGKMKEKEKDQIMNNFMKGETQILVSTTVIEVGIDVPDATIIVIDNPENFGLSALHQLRGRVGRGAKQSFCILLYGKKVGINGKKRLAIMKNSNDGFFIADEDLKLRGGGHLVGTRQSGLPTYKMANLETDLDLMKISLRASQILLEKDLTFEDKEKIRNLLRIFDLQECFKIVFGG